MNDSEGASEAMAALIEALVDSNHILFDQGVVDGFGHVSARHPEHPERFLLSRSMAPALVTAADIMVFDLDGAPLDQAGRAIYLERFIHGAIFRARPDVAAVVHSHSPAVVPFSVVPSMTLKPVCHMCGFLGSGAPIFEIRDVAGNASDLLIRDLRLGHALAEKLGAGAAVLMRGHGSTVVGQTLRQAVFRAVYTEVGARLQAEATRLGAVTYLNEAEAEAASLANDGQIGRAWDLWLKAARRRAREA